jgi:hypothetical protein
VEVVTTDDVPNAPDKFLDFPVRYTPGFRFPLYKHICLTFDVKMVAYHFLRRFRPQLMHVATPGFFCFAAIIYARLLRIPLVFSYHTHLPIYARCVLGLGAASCSCFPLLGLIAIFGSIDRSRSIDQWMGGWVGGWMNGWTGGNFSQRLEPAGSSLTHPPIRHDQQGLPGLRAGHRGHVQVRRPHGAQPRGHDPGDEPAAQGGARVLRRQARARVEEGHRHGALQPQLQVGGHARAPDGGPPRGPAAHLCRAFGRGEEAQDAAVRCTL